MKSISPLIEICQDGSSTLIHPILGDYYHSTRGAYGESEYVYIKNGLNRVNKESISILEMGFGSGLNALLSLKESIENSIKIEYTTIEAYPVSIETIKQLNYQNYCSSNCFELFLKMHSTIWEEEIKLTDNFTFKKINADLETLSLNVFFDLVYFDAFSPETQPNLWSESIFKKIYSQMNKNAILVTYSAKGIVKENLRAVGFNVKRVKGALGKHHMVIAIKD